MPPKPDQWMPMDVRAYLGDTMHLTRDQHGAYLLLIFAYWMRGSPLNDNDNELSAIAKASISEWRKLRSVVGRFFEIAGGLWRHKRIERELARARAIIETRAEAGRKGADARWQTDGKGNGKRMANASGRQWQNDGPTPTQSQLEDLRNFVVGKGAQVAPPMTDQNKIALFQKWLATIIGEHGWQIVGVAADPEADGFEEAVRYCREVAKNNGKGWPHSWPSKQATAGSGS